MIESDGLPKRENYFYVKVCGLTNLEDATSAVSHGADILGMVFHPKSLRLCKIEIAEQIKAAFPSKPRVLVFGYDSKEFIFEIYSHLRDMLCLIQLPYDHQEFSAIQEMLSFSKILPSVSVRGRLSEHDLNSIKANPLLILDSPPLQESNIPGGTGRTFNWDHIKKIQRPYLLAGGLNPDNICDALRQVDPFGVDVASGLEAEAGKKDLEKMRIFFEKIRNFPHLCG